ncbi:MAG TPA: hypothetical protein VF149_00300 [Bacillales bacterium]
MKSSPQFMINANGSDPGTPAIDDIGMGLGYPMQTQSIGDNS